MLLMPKKDWQWKYNDAHGVLSLSLGPELEFLTPYAKKLLIPDALGVMEFSVENAKFYIDLIDRLQDVLTCTESALVQIALNATAAHFMLKPQMPKSWFFESSQVCVYSEQGKVFELICSQTRQKSLVLAVESTLQATLVMVLSAETELNDSKTLKQFDTIKVMQDRLHSLKSKSQAAA
ncbi:cell division protein ZapC [Shewanella sp. 202IG2-18]|uniref:cell division protein ZapC n=1 Tax=Parashewanella hymeniacidonis TaxID=2807618 RepID=UPI00195F5DE9|nr:cell division protein ZapC [Parashewanella hymeniacidonis]MBM7071913.1 cell division protein ZapC [Parashewanella hymeniacidonis]